MSQSNDNKEMTVSEFELYDREVKMKCIVFLIAISILLFSTFNYEKGFRDGQNSVSIKHQTNI